MNTTDNILSDFDNHEIEANFLQKIAAYFIDWVFEIILIVLLLFIVRNLLSDIIPDTSWTIYSVVIIVVLGYRLLTLLFLGRTFGMIGVRVKYLNEKLLPLSLKEKVLTVFVVGVTDVKMYKQK